MSRIASLLLALALALPAAGAAAQSYEVRFRNGTDGVVYRIYSSPTNNPSWRRDLLGSNVLQPGQHLDATFHNVSNCMYDVAVQFRNGRVFTDVFNLCNTSVYVIG